MKWSWPMRKVWQWIPAGVLLVVSIYCAQPQIPALYFWLARFGFCPALMLALDPKDFKRFMGLND